MNNILYGVAVFVLAVTLPITVVHAQILSEASPSPTIEYTLPYPGMLPDSPLYKLKVFRDKIMLATIRDPQSKMKYYLNLANKQILMSFMLAQKGNSALAQQTALKGEDNMTQITFMLKRANVKPTEELYKELKLASAKHLEVLTNTETVLATEDTSIFKTVKEFSVRNAQEIDTIYNSPN